MRIAVWHNLPSGGGLRVLNDQLRGLAARGHELHVWAPPSAAPCDSTGVAASSHEVPLTLASRDGTVGRVRSAWRGRREDLDAFANHSASCARDMSDFAPDIVLAHSCQFFRVPAIAQYLEIPSVVYLHEPNRRLYEATSGFPWAARGEERTLRPSSIRRFLGELIDVELLRIQVRTETAWLDAFDEVLVNSLFSRESVLRAYGRVSQVSPPGIDTDRFPALARPSAVRGNVLTVGAMVGEKNAEFLVPAVAAAGSAVHQFIWVANYVDDEYWQLVRRVAADAGISVDLRPQVTERALLQCYAEADVFVYAPRLEPLGLAPLEASATGLPVVAVAEAGVRETVVDEVNGILVDHDEASFGAALAGLLRDPRRVRSLGSSATEYVMRRWLPDAAIDRLERHLLSVFSRQGATRVAVGSSGISRGGDDA